MKRINFNIKDRKFLLMTLSLVMVCVFTLSIAYAALNAVLTIQGNARVSAADWDIYLNNPRVTSGSATTDVPIVNGVTATFNTTLNMPGDFYEFTVDVVNGGDIDAMIENVVKSPDLTAEQAKFLKYEITYQNGESITTKQLLAKDTTMPIKVRIEYRKDLSNSDLPTGQVVLDLSLTLEYIQSDGTGSSVKDNGAWTISANGDINEMGTIVTIGSEQFYTMGVEGNNLKLFSIYPLYVGGTNKTDEWVAYGDEATGMQDSGMRGSIPMVGIRNYGVTAFSSDTKKGTNYSSYNGSIVEEYVNNYKTLLESKFNVDVVETRLLSEDDLINTFGCSFDGRTCSGTKYSWLFDKTIWTSVPYDDENIYYLFVRGELEPLPYFLTSEACVRPVVVISTDYFK